MRALGCRDREALDLDAMVRDDRGTLVPGLICGRRLGVAPGAKVVGAVMLP